MCVSSSNCDVWFDLAFCPLEIRDIHHLQRLDPGQKKFYTDSNT